MNNFAITSAGIGEALQRSASALYAAGNTLDESVALVTAANSVIQNPEQVGTALKTLSLRLRGAKTELEEAGEDVEGMAKNTSELQAKLKALTHGKVDIMLDANTFKSTTQILREMSAAWEDMTDIERASALELMGGKRQSNILSSVITNFDTVEDVIATSTDSAGSAMAENEKWLDSIEGKTYQFTNALQTMWSNLIDSEVVKGFLGFGTKAIEFLDTGTGKVIALVAALKLMAKFKGFSIGGVVQGLGSTIQNITKAQQTLQALSAVSPVTGTLSTDSINAYAQAVAGLTAKQQANLLASQNLTRQDIQRVLQTNQCTEAEMREAMAHVYTKNTKDQDAMASQQLLAIKAKEMAASYQAQAAKLMEAGATETDTAVTEANTAAEMLNTAASQNASQADLYETVTKSNLTATTKQQIIAELGLTGAKKAGTAANYGLLASIKALYASNPYGWIMMIISGVIMLVQWLSSLSDEASKSAEEIEQSLSSTINKCREAANEFKQLTKSSKDAIPRFAELSEGVDRFGKNISLTDEEYEEFLDLNNQIAEMFPSINIGFDENGNAMLALSGSADTLKSSLMELVEIERKLANEEIAKQIPTQIANLTELETQNNKDIQKYNQYIENYKKAKEELDRIYGPEAEAALRSQYGDNWEVMRDKMVQTDSEIDDLVMRAWGTPGNGADMAAWQAMIGKYTNGDGSIDWYKLINSSDFDNRLAGFEKKINSTKDSIKNNWQSLASSMNAWLQTDSTYNTMSDPLQYLASRMVFNLDYGSDGLKSKDQIETYIKDYIIDPLKNASPEIQDEISTMLSITPDGKTTQEYIDAVWNSAYKVHQATGFSTEALLKNLGFQDIIDGYLDAANIVKDALSDDYFQTISPYSTNQALSDWHLAEQLRDNFSTDELMRAVDLVKNYGVSTWDGLQKHLENRTFEMSLDFDKESEGLDNLSKAIEESLSATGLSAESIANLKDRYQDLENYDPAILFEETTNGIRLNTSALRELEQAYKEQNKDDLDKKLDGLVEHYNDLTAQIDDCTDASKRAQLYSQRQNVLNQINDTATLAAKYAGLTSAYNEWKNAQSGGNERDMYEGIISGRKEMDEEMSRGWVDEGTRQYLELLSGKDLSTASFEEILDLYKQMNNAVNSSGYNVWDFFTQDGDGNSTTDGIFNFFDAVKVAQAEVGANWVRIGEDGKYIFDFGEGGDKAVAEALGISEELVQIILRAAQDAGFTVNLDSAYSQLADFKDEVQEFNDWLIAFGATEYRFNINSKSVTDLNEQITEAEKAMKYLLNEDGTLKVDVSEEDFENAKTLLATLIYQKQQLDEAAILKVKIENPDSAIEAVVGKLQDFKAAYNEYEVKAAIGVDTTEAEADMAEVVNSFTDEEKEILTTLGVDFTKSNAEIIAAIDSIGTDKLIELGLDTTLIDGYISSDHTTAGTVVWDNNIDKVTEWASTTKTANGIVVWSNKLPISPFAMNADGTAHVSGTAFADGSWGAQKTETSLVGELGPEILVRNGKWTTVGENGAEFTQVKKGDIIFNHKQTESLLKNGYVTGRGKAHASGTAFSKGTDGPSRFAVTSTYKAGGGADRLKDAADEFLEVFDWIAVRLEEINEELDLRSAQLENQVGYEKQNEKIKEMIEYNKTLKTNLEAAKTSYNNYASELLSKVKDEYKTIAQNGAIDIEVFRGEIDEKQLEAIKEYREWVQKGADATKQAEETLTEISSLAKQSIDNIAAQFDNEASLRENKSDQLDAYNELLENKYGVGSEEIYRQLMAANNTDITELQAKKLAMQNQLNEKVEKGEIAKFSQDWYDAVNDIAAVDTEIINLKNDNLDLQDSINEIHWYHSDLLISQFDAVAEEAENLIDILQTKDVVDEMGSWTDEGITALGLYAQKMEVAQKQAEQYADDIDYLNTNWQSLGYTEEEYLDKLDELKSGQYDAIKSYNDSKDAIVDLNKERIDSIKNGIEKEIDAYEELIDKKKEELDAEQDLYDFQKKVRQSAKDIADLERQLAALSADNSASARAKRAQLEAELAEARQEQEDMYYERSVSNQQEALDKELESFQKEKEAEIEGWEEYLEDTEKVVSDSLAVVQGNTDTVLKTLNQMGNEYSLKITESLKSPWENSTAAISSYQSTFGTAVSETMDMLDGLSSKYKALEGEMAKEVSGLGTQYINDVNTNASKYVEADKKEETPPPVNTPVVDEEPSTMGMVSSLSGYIRYGDTGEKVKKLQKALNDLGFNCGNVDGIFGPKTLAAVKNFQSSSKYGGAISADGVVGPDTKNKFKTAKYARGTVGVDKDQWALIDELGEELILRAQNGRLTYLEKGSGVVPADLTANLMEWGKLDPSIMLDQNRPKVGVSPEIHNTQIQIDNSIAELIHIDHCDQGTLPDVEKIVNKALEKHTQKLNQSLRKYAR